MLRLCLQPLHLVPECSTCSALSAGVPVWEGVQLPASLLVALWPSLCLF